MKSEKKIWFILLGAFFLISGCQDDKGTNDYSGVSELISERNNARYEAFDNLPEKPVSSKKKIEKKVEESVLASDDRQERLLSIVLYEEKVKIVGSDSGKTLAKGIAYVNKKGQIVKIKILKD